MSRFTPRAQSSSFIGKVFGSGDGARVDELNQWLESTLKRELELDGLERDEEGDIPIAVGSTAVFVRVIEENLLRIEIFAPLLHDFAMRPEIYQAVNSINRKTPLAKAVVDPDNSEIVLSTELYIFDGLSPDQLMATIDLVADRADHYDTLLQKRFGGKTLLDDANDDEFDV